MSIEKQISKINKEIKEQAELIAVSKTRSIEDINEAYNQGQKKFGENRVQEIVDKFNKLPKDIEWHMIGHLQKNKVKYISEFISLIHSLDRLSLANEIDKNGKKHDKSINCLIQIKISKEESKFGLNIGDLDSFYKQTRKEGFGPEVKRRIITGTYVLSAGYYDAYYLKAQKVRQLINQDFLNAFEEVDVIMGPTTQQSAFKLGDKLDDPVSMYMNDIYTISSNLSGVPAISHPIGFVDNLPFGMQVIAPHFMEHDLLNIVHQYQVATDWHLQIPAVCREFD